MTGNKINLNEPKIIGPIPQGSDPQSYNKLRRQLLWKIPTGLYLLGAAWKDQVSMMTVNQVCQISSDPKILVAGLEKNSYTYSLAKQSNAFSLCFLKKDQRELIRKFVKRPNHEIGSNLLAGFPYYLSAIKGTPVLESVDFYLELVIVNVVGFKSHDAVFGEVVNVCANGDLENFNPLVMSDTRMSYGG
jgi:flavin reductase (DIM6/NTAB) family NADH-FMN oxidoreductase RutF